MREIGVVVIAAGHAGLAAGRALQKEGADFLLLEQGACAAGAWPLYYDSLTLFSPARYSSLPDFPFPGDPDDYPRRDDVVAYLKAYARRFDLPIGYHMRVTSVTPRADGRFTIICQGQGAIDAGAVIVATGAFEAPYIPSIEGLGAFSGAVVHSSAYRSPGPLAEQRVVVVGSANSAVQIAVELAGVADVTLAVRKPVRYAPQRLIGRDVHFWFQLLGVDRVGFLSDQGTPVLDDGRYRAALSAGQPAQRKMFTSMWRDGVVWSDGKRERVDTVLFATGFRPHAPFLPSKLAFTNNGRLAQKDGVSTRVQGLYYLGQPGLRSFASATLRGVGVDAAHIAPRAARWSRRLPVARNAGSKPRCCGLAVG